MINRSHLFNSVLSEVKIILDNQNIDNNNIQENIENFVYNQFNDFIEKNKGPNILNINLSMLNPHLRKKIIELQSNDNLNESSDNLNNSLVNFKEFVKDQVIKINSNNSKKPDNSLDDLYEKKEKLSDKDCLTKDEKKEIESLDRKINRRERKKNQNEVLIKMNKLLNTVDFDQLKGVILTYYMQLLSNVYRNEHDDNGEDYLINVAITFGKRISKLYYRALRNRYFKTINEENVLRFSEWFSNLTSEDKYYHNNNKFYMDLGAKIIDILESNGLITKEIEYRYRGGNLVSVVKIPEDIKRLINKTQLSCAPSHLPMIVPPKPYTNNELGGYLFNDK